MFGEKALLGQNELTVDFKGRIFIPANTNREVGEELVLLYDKDLDVHKIYRADKIGQILEGINKKILDSKNKKEELYFKKKLCEISKSILKYSKIDSQGRLSTGKIFENEEKILSIGCQDHLMIETMKKK